MPGWKRASTAVGVAAAAVAWGIVSLRLQEHFSAEVQAGADLNPLAQLLADGSSARTAWIGWAAAGLFQLAVVRLWIGPPEPPVGRPDGRRWTATEMRASLRTEHSVVRSALVAVGSLAAIDAGRALVYVVASARGFSVARETLGATLVEAAGLGAATAILALWRWRFGQMLQRWGAL
jgi:hypothetical protein